MYKLNSPLIFTLQNNYDNFTNYYIKRPGILNLNEIPQIDFNAFSFRVLLREFQLIALCFHLEKSLLQIGFRVRRRSVKIL